MIVAMAMTVTVPVTTSMTSTIVTVSMLLTDPLLLHKVNVLAASAVAVAMLVPMFGMAWWHVHVHRLRMNGHRCGQNQHGTWQQDGWWWQRPKHHTPVGPRLADGHGDTTVDHDLRCRRQGKQCHKRCNGTAQGGRQTKLHDNHSFVQ